MPAPLLLQDHDAADADPSRPLAVGAPRESWHAAHEVASPGRSNSRAQSEFSP
jgi:hypothetical protein